MSTSISSDTVPSQSMTVVQLKDICRERGLPVSGTKSQLLERINAVKDEEKPLSTQQEDISYSGVVIAESVDDEEDNAVNDDPTLLDIHPSLLNILIRRLGGGEDDDENSGSS
eukprot:5935127-Ditylum_brightwellii.AAC.2